MQFGSSAHTKFEYAKTLVATLSYFLLQQRDIVGLARFESQITDYLDARWRPGHLKRIFALLAKGADGAATNINESLEQLTRLLHKRGLVVLVSDFLSDPDEWQTQLSQLSATGHDVRAIQVLDPTEISLEFGKAAYWEDIETEEVIYVDPQQLKKRYQKRFEERQQKLTDAFSASKVSHQIITTEQPLDLALLNFVRNLRTRKAVKR